MHTQTAFAVEANSVNLTVGSTQILRNCSLAIPPRGLTSVVGPSGAGKTSLLFCLSGLDKPDAGRVSIGGTDIYGLGREARARFLRERVGFVFQQYNLIPYLTVEENVTLPTTMAHKKVDYGFMAHTLDTLGLADKQKTRSSLLSAGEQQRVALCRTIVAHPQVIFADEPTGALDSQNSSLVLHTLRSMASEGATIVMVTHDVDIASLADRVVFIHDGAVTKVTDHPIGPAEISAGMKQCWSGTTDESGGVAS